MTLARPALLACAALQALLLAACASQPGDAPDGRPADLREGAAPPDGAPDAGPHGGRLRALFISPAGEPFHGTPDGPPPVAVWFAGADADHDGRLTRGELAADFDRFFKTLDTNGDGVIDGFEAQAYERKIAPELLPQVGRLRAGEGQDERLLKGGRGGGMGRGGGRGDGSSLGGGFGGAKHDRSASNRGAQGVGAYQFFPDLEPITAADSDLDGKVTLAEWRARAKAVFTQLDVKEAGFLTLASLPKTPQQAAIDKRKAAQERRRTP